MGGPQATTSVDQGWRAITCIADSALAARVESALVGAEFEVSVGGVLADVAAEPGDRPAVLVFDQTRNGWLGTIAGLTGGRLEVRPLLLADLDGPDAFLSALSAGVAGFCSPNAPADAIIRSVRSMIAEGVAIPRTLVAPLVAELRRGRGHAVHTAAGDVVVTDREWEILQMLVQGRSTREMAGALFVSVGTVRSHVSTLLKKLGAVDRDDAVALIDRGYRDRV